MNASYDELLFELPVPGRDGYSLPEADVPEAIPPPPAGGAPPRDAARRCPSAASST